MLGLNSFLRISNLACHVATYQNALFRNLFYDRYFISIVHVLKGNVLSFWPFQFIYGMIFVVFFNNIRVFFWAVGTKMGTEVVGGHNAEVLNDDWTDLLLFLKTFEMNVLKLVFAFAWGKHKVVLEGTFKLFADEANFFTRIWLVCKNFRMFGLRLKLRNLFDLEQSISHF